MEKTKHGVALIDGTNENPFGIIDNPVNSTDIPESLKQWRFADEYDAMLVLALWNQYSKRKKKIDAILDINKEFKYSVVIPTFRILGIPSVWAMH